MMDLHYLKLFHILASQKSYTKAAELLFISQPALSMQIKKFEDELGMKLFDRVGNKNILNENGKLLYGFTQKIFATIEEAEHQLMNKTDCISGTINIGGSNTSGAYILPKIIGIFKRMYPHVNVNLHVSDTNEIAHMISDNQLDFAINGGVLDYSSNIHVERLMEDKVMLIASPENELSGKEYIQCDELAPYNFITHERHSQLYRLTERLIREMNIPSEITMTFGNIDAIKQAVAANLGVALIPQTSITFELKLGIIKELRIRDRNWTYPYSLIYNNNHYLSPAVKKLIELVRDSVYKGSLCK